MTDKEFKRLTRAQLIDIIYQFQLKVDELNDRIQELEAALADKRFRIDSAGNIAEAALEINDCFLSAQNAVEQYLDEIKAIREDTEAQRQQILAAAREEAKDIVANTKTTQGEFETAVEAILEEYRQNHTDNG